jgi:hypothetical protein
VRRIPASPGKGNGGILERLASAKKMRARRPFFLTQANFSPIFFDFPLNYFLPSAGN